jgi:peptide-methionine (R)-S-oxide reductase
MSAFDLTPPTDAERRAITAGLSGEERRVLLEHGTEAAFCGVFLDNKKNGIYTCRFCGLPLFRSNAKFDSGTGWPSFFKPFTPLHIKRVRDSSYGMVRVEEVCARCGSHLGHVFPDGPQPTGERHCLDSLRPGRRFRTYCSGVCRRGLPTRGIETGSRVRFNRRPGLAPETAIR